MKRILAVSLAMLLILCLAACGSNSNGKSSHEKEKEKQTEKETKEEAEELAGFSLTIPERLEQEGSTEAYRAMKDSMLEVLVSGEEDQIRIRKGAGEEDISGDYTVYEKEDTVEIGGRKVTVKGDETLVYLAVWQEGEYSYSVSSENGMALEDMTQLVEGIQ